MKIVVACGGTGGHAFPGLAVAEELKSRGHDVTVWDSGRDIESSVMRSWHGPVFSTGAKQLSARNVFSILRSILRCRREMRRTKPDVLLAMGSYSSLPPVLAARGCGVPVVLHEANTVPGRAVEFLSRFAKKVAISFGITARHLPGCDTTATGLPVRADIASGTRFDFIPKDSFVVFVTGGSQGAHMVNCLASEALAMMKGELDRRAASGREVRPLYVIHQTGIADEGAVMATYASVALKSRVQAFEREMANAFASADIVIARAGASTCFELAACGKAAMLIPLPSAMRNHQHFNADAFASKGAADEGMQSQLSAKQLYIYLMGRYDRPERLAEMSAKMRGLATPDAAARVADLVEDAAKEAEKKRVRAIVSLGSNIEPRAEYLSRAVDALAAFPETKLVAASGVVETEPVDVPPEFAAMKFMNQVAVLETALSAREFSKRMHEVEDALGRRRTVRNGPRTIDIDLVDFGGMVSDDPDLTLPHPRARMRDFVMGPLAELGLADCLGCSGDSGAANAPGKGK